MTGATITVYEDEGGQWRWRMSLGNHVKFASSGEAFDSKSNAIRAATRLSRLMSEADEITVEIP